MRARVAIVSAVIALAVATAARANLPAGAFVSVERTIDVASFSRTIATRYDIVVRGALTADIDRDGDLDVVASTDRGFLVWVNDGNGRLTSKKPEHKPIVDGCPPDDTWEHGGACDGRRTFGFGERRAGPRSDAGRVHAPGPSVLALASRQRQFDEPNGFGSRGGASLTAVQRCEAWCVFFLPLFSWSAAPRGRMRRR